MEITVDVVEGSICQQTADVIVNATNSRLSPEGKGIDACIRQICGFEKMKDALQEIIEEKDCGHLEIGEIVSTPSFLFENCHKIYHAHGPENVGIDPTRIHEAHLLMTYLNILRKCQEEQYSSIVIPFLSLGPYGYPATMGMKVAYQAALVFIEEADEKTTVKKITFASDDRDNVHSFKKIIGGQSVTIYSGVEANSLRNLLEGELNLRTQKNKIPVNDNLKVGSWVTGWGQVPQTREACKREVENICNGGQRRKLMDSSRKRKGRMNNPELVEKERGDKARKRLEMNMEENIEENERRKSLESAKKREERRNNPELVEKERGDRARKRLEMNMEENIEENEKRKSLESAKKREERRNNPELVEKERGDRAKKRMEMTRADLEEDAMRKFQKRRVSVEEREREKINRKRYRVANVVKERLTDKVRKLLKKARIMSDREQELEADNAEIGEEVNLLATTDRNIITRVGTNIMRKLRRRVRTDILDAEGVDLDIRVAGPNQFVLREKISFSQQMKRDMMVLFGKEKMEKYKKKVQESMQRNIVGVRRLAARNHKTAAKAASDRVLRKYGFSTRRLTEMKRFSSEIEKKMIATMDLDDKTVNQATRDMRLRIVISYLQERNLYSPTLAERKQAIIETTAMDLTAQELAKKAVEIRDQCIVALLGAAKARVSKKAVFVSEYEKAVFELAGPHYHVRSHDPADEQRSKKYRDADELYPEIVAKLQKTHLKGFQEGGRSGERIYARSWPRSSEKILENSRRAQSVPPVCRYKLPIIEEDYDCNKDEFITYMREADEDCCEKIAEGTWPEVIRAVLEGLENCRTNDEIYKYIQASENCELIFTRFLCPDPANFLKEA